MKKLFLLPVFLCVLCIASRAQLIAKGDPAYYGPRISLSEIPDMPVRDGNGNTFKLAEYIRNNRLYPDKPILVYTWFTFCAACVRQVDSLAANRFGDRFNVVTILLKHTNATTPETKSLDEYIKGSNTRRDWNKFMNLVSDDTLSERYLWNGKTTPLFLFADKNMKIYHHFVSLSLGMVDVAADILTRIDKGNYGYQPGKLYYDNREAPVAPSSPDAESFIRAYRSGQYLYVQSGSKKDSSKSLERFIERNREFIYDGVFQVFDKDGKMINSATYREGALAETLRQTFNDGKVRAIIPVNGVAKRFDEEGRLTLEGPMRDGLGNGLFRQYDEGVLSAEIMIKQGMYEGAYKRYEDGVLSSTDYYEKGRKVRSE
jgi:antitoxin component YwqK of YwqJK toxin-antitoxin module